MARFLLARWHYRLPAFGAATNIRIVLFGRAAVIPVASVGGGLNLAWRRDVDRGCIGLAVSRSTNGQARDRQDGSGPRPVWPLAMAMTLIVVVLVVSLRGAAVTLVAPPVGLGATGAAESEAEGKAEGGRFFHGLAHNCFADERITRRGRYR